jgi:hypothetical protein
VRCEAGHYKGSVIRAIAPLMLLCCVALTGTAAAATPLPDWSGYTPPPRPFAGPVRDHVLHDPALRRSATVAASSYRRYTITNGPTILVQVSPSYTTTSTSVQNYLDSVFGWLAKPAAHGSEVSSIRVYIAPASEVQQACGASDALACYSPYSMRMVVAGEDSQNPDDPPLPFLAAHEYGHHIAANRLSPQPFDSGNWGAPHWSTYERVCPQQRQGGLFPGDENQEYWNNPGEAWAEAFADRLFPAMIGDWHYASSLRPTSGSYGAIRHDVQAPWRRYARKAVSWRVGPGRPRTKRFKLSTPLDGAVRIRISGTTRPRFTIYGAKSKKRVITSRSRFVQLTACGNRSAEFRVVRRSGAGLVKVSLSRP